MRRSRTKNSASGLWKGRDLDEAFLLCSRTGMITGVRHLGKRQRAALLVSIWAGSGMFESAAHAQAPDAREREEDLTETIPGSDSMPEGDLREDVETGNVSSEGSTPNERAASASEPSSETR